MTLKLHQAEWRVADRTPITLDFWGDRDMARTRLQGMDLAGVKLAIEVPEEWAAGERGGAPDAASRWPRGSALDAEIHVGVRIATAESPLRDAFWYRGQNATFEVGRCLGSPSRPGDWVVAVYGPRGCERVARFDDALRDIDLVVDPVAAASFRHPLEDPIDEILLIHQLAASGGALVRGAVSRGDTGGAVLTLEHHNPISDLPNEASGREQAVLRIGSRDDEVWLIPVSPDAASVRPEFHGRRLRLEEVRVLEAARQPFRERLDPDTAACELLAHVSAPVHFPEGAESAASTIRRIAAKVPVTLIAAPQSASIVYFPWGNRHAGSAFAPPA